MDQFSGYAQQGALYRQGDSAPSNQGYYNPVQSLLDANKKKIANQFTGIETGTLQYLASQGNQGAAAELSKRQLQEPRPGALATAEDAPVPMMVEPPALPDPDVNDPRTPVLITDGSAANRAVASSGGVLEDPTAAPSADAAVLSQTNANAANTSSVGGGSVGGNRTTGSTTQSTSRSVSPSTGNARGSRMGYGKANNAEMLMRVGGAMYSGSLQGDGIGAATREYGSIQDDRRAADTAAYEAAEAKRLKEAAIRAAAARSGGAGGKAGAANSKALSGVNDAMYGMQQGLDAIAASRAAGGNLTGVGGIFKGLIDNFTGDADANRRLTLSRLKVNDALLRTAETKGAISNSEMNLFLSPAPTNLQDEQVWVDWLNQRMAALQRVQERLNGGAVLSDAERSTNFNTASGTFTPSADVQAALDKYK